jgi:hypothetical protein
LSVIKNISYLEYVLKEEHLRMFDIIEGLNCIHLHLTQGGSYASNDEAVSDLKYYITELMKLSNSIFDSEYEFE